MNFMRRGTQSLSAHLFSCSRRTLSGILIACFHFMIIRGLIDLIYFNFLVPSHEALSLRDYIRMISDRRVKDEPYLVHVANHSTSELIRPSQPPSFLLNFSNLAEFANISTTRPPEDGNPSPLLPPDTTPPPEIKSPAPPPPPPRPPAGTFGTHIPAAEPHAFVDIGTNSSFCGTDDTFQYGFDFLKGDLRMGSFELSPGSSYACCRQCETLALCTHWTWFENFCWLKNGPTAMKPKAGVVSGRVALNQWVERRIIIPVKRRPYNCTHDEDDRRFFEPDIGQMIADPSQTPTPPRLTRYMVINEPRTGSSWLQEVSQMHPGIKVQFELDMEKGDAALTCRQCSRPTVPNSKYASRLPKKLHPPLACGMTIFGANNKFGEVSDLANRHGALLVILLRANHVAHAISAYRHFNKPKPTILRGGPLPILGFDNQTLAALAAAGLTMDASGELLVPWDSQQLRQNVEELRQSYARLVRFPSETKRPTHFIFYEDLKKYPSEVWARLQKVLNLPVVELQNISNLERKSTSKPSIYYLMNLTSIQRDLTNTSWYPMVMDPYYDDTVDVSVNFAKICARYPDSQVSWRLHICENGVMQPWHDRRS